MVSTYLLFTPIFSGSYFQSAHLRQNLYGCVIIYTLFFKIYGFSLIVV